MQTQNLCEKKQGKTYQTSAPVSLKNSYFMRSLDLEMPVGFILEQRFSKALHPIHPTMLRFACCKSTAKSSLCPMCNREVFKWKKTLQHVGHLVNLITPHRAELHCVGCHIDLLSNTSNGAVVIRKTQVCRCSDCSVERERERERHDARR